LALKAMGARMVMQDPGLDWRQPAKRGVMLGELALAGMEHLLFLFPALKLVLLLRRKRPSKGRKRALKRWDSLGRISAERRGRRRSVWDAHLWDKEGLPGISDAPN